MLWITFQLRLIGIQHKIRFGRKFLCILQFCLFTSNSQVTLVFLVLGPYFQSDNITVIIFI